MAASEEDERWTPMDRRTTTGQLTDDFSHKSSQCTALIVREGMGTLLQHVLTLPWTPRIAPLTFLPLPGDTLPAAPTRIEPHTRLRLALRPRLDAQALGVARTSYLPFPAAQRRPARRWLRSRGP